MRYIDYHIEILGQRNRVKLREDVTCVQFLNNIMDEFVEKLPPDQPFGLWLAEGGVRPIARETPLITFGAHTRFRLAAAGERVPVAGLVLNLDNLAEIEPRALPGFSSVRLVDPAVQEQYAVIYSAMVIGREGPIPNPALAHVPHLALHQRTYEGMPGVELLRVGRAHALLFEVRSYHYIVALDEHEITVNGKLAAANTAEPIQSQDVIALADSGIRLIFQRG